MSLMSILIFLSFVVLSYAFLLSSFWVKREIAKFGFLVIAFLSFMVSVMSIIYIRFLTASGTPFQERNLIEKFVGNIYTKNEWAIIHVVLFIFIFFAGIWSFKKYQSKF